MEAKFKVGDFIQHKDKNKREQLKLKGEIVSIGNGNDGTTPYYLLNYHGTFAVIMENQEDYEKVEVHHCNICGEPLAWDDNIWLNSSFGVCADCHDKIPEYINIDIQEERYTDQVKKFLDDLGATY